MHPGNASGLEGLGDWLGRLIEGIERWIEENPETAEGLVRQVHHHFLFKEAGWLPHHTTPFAMLHDEWSASELSAFLDVYYLDNWPKIRKEFKKHLDALKVDDEADLPLNFHPAALRASAGFTPWGAGGATCDRRSWSGLRRRSHVAERLAA
jgi:hypothetical protein